MIDQKYTEHSAWVQGWYQWADGLMMQMQQVPPQAYMEFDMRGQQLVALIISLKPSADALKTLGHPKLATLIGNTEAGAKKSNAAFQAAQKGIAKNNQKTQQAILKMNQKTNNEILGMQRDTHRAQVVSLDKSHDSFMDYLRS